MDTKWKNRLTVMSCLFLFTFGISGIISALIHGSDYTKKNYFQTYQFEDQLNQFINYLSTFELQDMTKEEAKKKITVTTDEIQEYRYRYGDLSEQISSIKEQYEYKIQDAMEAKNPEVADTYIVERDKKIEDITNNFKSDEYVRAKITKEKEQQIDEYYQEREKSRSEFLKYEATFKYYLKDTVTGKVYTNVYKTDEDSINEKKMLFIQHYPTAKQEYLSTEGRETLIASGDGMTPVIGETIRTFEGEIAVPKSASATTPVLMAYHEFYQKQKIFFIYTISSVLAFLLSLYLLKKVPVTRIVADEKWGSYYSKIPIDVRIIMLFVTSISFLLFSLLTIDNVFYWQKNSYLSIRDIIFSLIVASFFSGLTLIQGKFLLERLKERNYAKAEWQRSLLYKSYKGVQGAFLNRRIGTQICILLAVVFIFGAGIGMVVIEPVFIIPYAFLFVVIGLPIFMMILKYTGYFNQIIHHAGELARGNLEPDLPVKGKSVLALLANHINILKHGVKTSQKEQAKSERLKTELITNVSHDLRTPLTSIITYTELLKTAELTEEDRNAYIQIIDRKSKRLKILIDDLFEASKMASGNIELVKEKVDLNQLLQQALAEHNETINESTLQFRVATPDVPVYAIVDGQKLWRVFDNLIGNILKYSLDHTRVYISVRTVQDQAVIVFKNVTKYELGENSDELFERFKRGDTSRHTEGSGLGLAIAKSIVDLHGGRMDIDLDGDLFKVTVLLNAQLD
ncbi:MAG TPA: histidine kinase dimerization/phospho-acceptor domain-containing protein [Bacillus sp. (in: firmicutes)]|nr:histidine kinase dimerization/phospho-acceptor domain-containing protein [Bacillus sp. (in: firmicutes)]